MGNNSQYSLIVSSLEQFPEVNTIIVSDITNSDKHYVNCTVVCDVESVVDNMQLFKGINANLEIIKNRLNLFNVLFNYEIMTMKEYNDELIAAAIINKDNVDKNNNNIIFERKTVKEK